MQEGLPPGFPSERPSHAQYRRHYADFGAALFSLAAALTAAPHGDTHARPGECSEAGFQDSRFPVPTQHALHRSRLSAAGWGRGSLAIWKPGSLPGAPIARS